MGFPVGLAVHDLPVAFDDGPLGVQAQFFQEAPDRARRYLPEFAVDGQFQKNISIGSRFKVQGSKFKV
jgi:hypothetical protein